MARLTEVYEDDIKKGLKNLEVNIDLIMPIIKKKINLDELDDIIEKIRCSDRRKLKLEFLSKIMIDLSTAIYVAIDSLEETALKAELSRLIYKEVYIVSKSSAEGKVTEKEAWALLKSQNEALTNLICDKVYKIYKQKIEAAQETLAVVKKLVTVQGGKEVE